MLDQMTLPVGDFFNRSQTNMDAATLERIANLEVTAYPDEIRRLGLSREQYVASRLKDGGFSATKEAPSGELQALERLAPREAAAARAEFSAARTKLEGMRVTEAAYVRSRLRDQGFALPAKG